MVKAQRTDKKPIASNYYANILAPFLSTGKKVAKIKVNTDNGRFSAVLIPKT